MYLGSRAPHTQAILEYKNGSPHLVETTWIPANYTGMREIFDNALDEVVGHGHGNRVDITYDEASGVTTVEDNGRGIPISWDAEHNCHAATLALTEARAGRNFGERGEVAGTNGIGSSAVNFCSEFFTVEIARDNKKFVQNFREGNDILGDSLQIIPPKITDTKSQNTGTKVSFKLSSNVFPHIILPEKFVHSRVMEIALCNPLIKVTYNGHVIKVKPRSEQTLFPDIKPVSLEINDTDSKFRSKFWIVPDFVESGDHSHSIVNNIFALNGGVHMETFRRVFFANLINALERESKKRKLTPNRSDVQEGILIYNITNMVAPNFDSQSKTRLINEEVATVVKKILGRPGFVPRSDQAQQRVD